ncbi:MAG: type II toxin-antitoxin system Phd/YefM family antitoxin [Acidobacteria bacterium]|nr:type II toxin-antitoxin system Phd/YefM family antitoxin [Acidobacteriota bacterium]
MDDPISPTALRSTIYRVLDEIAESGEPREIVRGDRRFLILPLGPGGRRDLWDRPKRVALVDTTPEGLVSTRWDYEPDPEV